MDTQSRRCYIVHDRAGRIHAIAPITATQTPDGMNLGWRPVAVRNQLVSEIDLTAEHARLPLHELLAFKIKTDRRSGTPSLQSVAKPPRASKSQTK
ncbi:MAG: hypothetical protein ABI383_13595 [Acidobacteriaceae bacterium]